MRALVTGMTGFVGGHLVRALRSDGWNVHGTLLPGRDEAPPAGATGTPVDITDPSAMAELLAAVQPAAIFHLAGAASVGESFSDPDGTWRVNVEGTRGVLEGMRQAAPGARMVIALSGEEYGQVDPAELPVDEDTPLRPASPYAKSKVAAEELCEHYWRTEGLSVLRLRAFNQVGPGQDARFVVPWICKQIADAELADDDVCRLELGNIDVRRDFLDVRDVVHAYRLLIARGDVSQTYVAGRGRSMAVRDLVEMAVGLARVPVEVSSDASRVREGEPLDLYCEPRALRALGWKPEITIGQSVRETLNYWRQRAHVEVD